MDASTAANELVSFSNRALASDCSQPRSCSSARICFEAAPIYTGSASRALPEQYSAANVLW